MLSVWARIGATIRGKIESGTSSLWLTYALAVSLADMDMGLEESDDHSHVRDLGG
jgi:hypothetical protein